jgi:hypothetical protein
VQATEQLQDGFLSTWGDLDVTSFKEARSMMDQTLDEVEELRKRLAQYEPSGEGSDDPGLPGGHGKDAGNSD